MGVKRRHQRIDPFCFKQFDCAWVMIRYVSTWIRSRSKARVAVVDGDGKVEDVVPAKTTDHATAYGSTRDDVWAPC